MCKNTVPFDIEKEYLVKIEEFLDLLTEQLEALADEDEKIEDVNYSAGVLNLEMADGK